ncbi:hypothetical protein GLOTRDRAFT_141322 [Gloeophyllum trabeum ATCC 11539]|uniref:Uncharacterized protein n=1 Tax=Gloeophyllum trabeum (strain ATCC 11539 / FP-39264 / Madison 617) TaxID=670483 RepID=S7PTQ0_GLOTA|nr:uncharacterized protein GLOTRDRAFT_141322 [Gloeophyllum trabeum ATCC 11539]EPQ50823.1 hypothetical protein GLOTRDRAFT_141322 [Gloeophyllum trabeum ATCC 11539]
MSGNRRERAENYNPATTPKYLNDFSKALASEVRILLEEVGKLRDERRALQFEIAELMSMKSKHGAGGEYSPDWRPREAEASPPPPPAPEPAPVIEDPAPPREAKPGWRVVPPKRERRRHAQQQAAVPASPPPPPPPEPPKPNLPSWAQWRPNPLLAAPIPQAPAPSSPGPVVQRRGLFGPPSPPPQ